MKRNVRLTLLALLLASFSIVPAADTGNVQLDGGRCIKVDGKPFFPIGMYASDIPDFPMLASAGINLVHSYGWESSKAPEWGKQWMDAAHQHGLKTLVGLNRSEIENLNYGTSARRVELYRNHPALLAWQVMDEPFTRKGDRGDIYMPAIYQTIKQRDTRHPITAVLCHFVDYEKVKHCLDIAQADYYPVPPIPEANFLGNGFAGIVEASTYARIASNNQKPFWFVCQAFDYALIKKDKDIPREMRRFPTQEELRTMSYTAVAVGARGILYYSLGAMRTYLREGGTSAEECQRRVFSVTKELRALSPLLTAATTETFSRKDNIVSLIKSDGRDLYIITANYERKPTKTELQVPGIVNGTARVVFGVGTAPVVGGKLTLSLNSIESRVYVIYGAGLDTPLHVE